MKCAAPINASEQLGVQCDLGVEDTLPHDAVDILETPGKVLWNTRLPELLWFRARLANLTEHCCLQKPTAIIKSIVCCRADKYSLFQPLRLQSTTQAEIRKKAVPSIVIINDRF
jgi:hypothetical protein